MASERTNYNSSQRAFTRKVRRFRSPHLELAEPCLPHWPNPFELSQFAGAAARR
jgi:hypothetical protein